MRKAKAWLELAGISRAKQRVSACTSAVKGQTMSCGLAAEQGC